MIRLQRVLVPADGDGEEGNVPGAALLLSADGRLQRQTHAMALARQLHVPAALRAQPAQTHFTLHRVRLPTVLHHLHQLRGFVGLCSCMTQVESYK